VADGRPNAAHRLSGFIRNGKPIVYNERMLHAIRRLFIYHCACFYRTTKFLRRQAIYCRANIGTQLQRLEKLATQFFPIRLGLRRRFARAGAGEKLSTMSLR
jgi:hypothetical protein